MAFLIGLKMAHKVRDMFFLVVVLQSRGEDIGRGIS
jgi:hypothetical protein